MILKVKKIGLHVTNFFKLDCMELDLKRLAYLLYGSVASLPSPSSNIEAWPNGTSLRFAPAFRALGVCEHMWPFSLRDIWATILSSKWAEIFVAQMAGDETSLPRCKSIHNRDIPHQLFTHFPRSHGNTLWAFAGGRNKVE